MLRFGVCACTAAHTAGILSLCCIGNSTISKIYCTSAVIDIDLIPIPILIGFA